MPKPHAYVFPLLDEPPAIALVNTLVHQHGETVDLLDTPAALAAWLDCQRARLSWSGVPTPADLAAVRGLRSAIAALLDAMRQHAAAPACALRVFNAALARGRQTPVQLGWTRGQPRRLEARARSGRAVLLHAIASDAIALLTGPDAARIRACAHPDCILRFVAKNPRRRWCCAETCGNRARVARHYLRHHEAP